LPADYISVIDSFGGGRLDGYLWLLEPDCVNKGYGLIEAYDEQTEALDMLWDEGEPRPAEMTIPGSKLIPWASTDNGEFLYWQVPPGSRPGAWKVMVNEARGGDW
jgi:hypothetical protein